MLQGGSRSFDRRRLSRWVQQEYERYVTSHAADAYRHFCDTRNFAIRADLARALPFPELFPKGGDGVYGRWLEQKRIEIRYEPRWTVAHRDPSSRWRLGRTAFERGRCGEQWRAAAGIDLFGDARGADARKGPGFWLLRRLPKAPLTGGSQAQAFSPSPRFSAPRAHSLRRSRRSVSSASFAEPAIFPEGSTASRCPARPPTARPERRQDGIIGTPMTCSVISLRRSMLGWRAWRRGS